MKPPTSSKRFQVLLRSVHERRRAVQHKIRQSWQGLDRQQHRVLLILGLINVLVLGLLIVLLLKARSSAGQSAIRSPIPASQVESCQRAVSQALLNANQGGFVQASTEGGLLIKLYQFSPAVDLSDESEPQEISPSDVRLKADAAVWTALEAIAVASQGNCVGFDTVTINLVFTPQDAHPIDATAQIGLPDILLWSSNQIDDLELSRRIDYAPPETPTPDSS